VRIALLVTASLGFDRAVRGETLLAEVDALMGRAPEDDGG
jgi:hypothetical protein